MLIYNTDKQILNILCNMGDCKYLTTKFRVGPLTVIANESSLKNMKLSMFFTSQSKRTIHQEF